jgi:hypothetical protein
MDPRTDISFTLLTSAIVLVVIFAQPLIYTILIARLINLHVSKRWRSADVNRILDGTIIGLTFPTIQFVILAGLFSGDWNVLAALWRGHGLVTFVEFFLLNACAGFALGSYVPVTVAVNLIRMRSYQGQLVAG